MAFLGACAADEAALENAAETTLNSGSNCCVGRRRMPWRSRWFHRKYTASVAADAASPDFAAVPEASLGGAVAVVAIAGIAAAVYLCMCVCVCAYIYANTYVGHPYLCMQITSYGV